MISAARLWEGGEGGQGCGHQPPIALRLWIADGDRDATTGPRLSGSEAPQFMATGLTPACFGYVLPRLARAARHDGHGSHGGVVRSRQHDTGPGRRALER